MSRSMLSMSLLCLAAAISWSQTTTAQTSGGGSPVSTQYQDQQQANLLLALSDPTYPVTPGDVYRLAFLAGGETQVLDLLVRGDFRLNLGMFGSMNARGMTYPELSAAVERRVLDAYPVSSPTVVLASTGSFQVLITGETPRTSRATVWGLSRLSDVVPPLQTLYTSLRTVSVITSEGERKEYDLYRAISAGEMSQDPRLRPGDSIRLIRREKEVQLAGEISRPGKYQLLPGEDLSDLIETYGGGFTSKADPARVEIKRWGSEASESVKLLMANSASDANMALADLDVVTIRSREDLLPIVTFEGAITPIDRSATGVPRTRSRTSVRISEGETLASVLSRTGWFFLPEADVEHSYLMREGEPTPRPVDLASLSYRAPTVQDIVLRAGDTIIVPALEYYVTVSGAVYDPGRYLQVPGRTYRYYLDLAGGINPERQVGSPVVRITDALGNRKGIDDLIQADDIIFVPTNSPLYFASRIVPVLSGAATFTYYLVTIIRMLSGK